MKQAVLPLIAILFMLPGLAQGRLGLWLSTVRS
ncbi:Uncharacterised protein [Citrobacter freundii]|nr:Uncharacterised protein [Citrobacter freundii]